MKSSQMMFIPAGRAVWREISTQLEASGLTPAIWLGDPRHDEFARERFPQCVVLDFKRIHISLDFPPVKHVPDADFLLDRRFLKLRDQVIKLMDRQDDLRTFGRLEREGHFYGILLRLYSLIQEHGIAALVASEAPHSPATLTAFGVCQIRGIPTFHLVGNSVVPLVHLKTSILGDPLECCGKKDVSGSLRALEQFLTSFETSVPTPLYMQEQAAYHDRWNPFTAMAKHLRIIAAKRARTLIGKPSKSADYTINRRFPLESNRVPLFSPLWVERMRRTLEEHYMQVAQPANSIEHGARRPYAYFPMHYEPEKTSNPDGGDYYNSIDALVSLRAYLPADMHIYVKEHPSQFSRALRGHRGRSPYMYDVIGSLPNVSLIEAAASSAGLIRQASVVASLSGTACLEAALLGRKAILFGDAWFSGFPNIYRFSELPSYEAFSVAPIWPTASFREAIREYADLYAIPGCVNPSNEGYFRRKYPDVIGDMMSDPEMARLVSETIIHHLPLRGPEG